MLLDLNRKGRPGPGSHERPKDLLLACHQKIRSFSNLALAIVDSVAPSAREVADAAGALARYFGEALPLHVADEERTIRRHLLEATPTGPVALALEAMAREHSDHALVLADLMPCWSALAEEPRLLAELALRLREARKLGALFGPHLELEEERIFPALDGLPADASLAILSEMRARRSPASVARLAPP